MTLLLTTGTVWRVPLPPEEDAGRRYRALEVAPHEFAIDLDDGYLDDEGEPRYHRVEQGKYTLLDIHEGRRLVGADDDESLLVLMLTLIRLVFARMKNLCMRNR